MIFVLMGMGGVALDVGRAYSIKSKAQSALDAAVLAATNVLVADADRQSVFAAVFAENFKASDGKLAKVTYNYAKDSGGVGKVEFVYRSYLAGVLGKSEFTEMIESYAAQTEGDLEIVLVLDVSGSMRAPMGSGTRLAALKSSAKNLIDILEKAKMPNQSIKYSLVPFTMNVNIGTDNAAFVDNVNSPLFAGTTWAGCVLERPAQYANQDVYNGSFASSGGRWQAYVWPPEPNKSNTCVNPSNGTNLGYKSVQSVGPRGKYDPWTKGPNYNCIRHSIVPLTSDATEIESAVDTLESHPNMGTILAPGISWGHRVLSPEAPFSEGASFSAKTRKIMIVITDGEQTTEGEYQSASCTTETNTVTPYSYDPLGGLLIGGKLQNTGPRDMFTPYGYVYDSQPFGSVTSWKDVRNQLDTVTLDACSKFKARGGLVDLYTIAASSAAGPGTAVYSLLEKCATSPKQFFYAKDADKLAEAFLTIAKAATPLRLTN